MFDEGVVRDPSFDVFYMVFFQSEEEERCDWLFLIGNKFYKRKHEKVQGITISTVEDYNFIPYKSLPLRISTQNLKVRSKRVKIILIIGSWSTPYFTKTFVSCLASLWTFHRITWNFEQQNCVDSKLLCATTFIKNVINSFVLWFTIPHRVRAGKGQPNPTRVIYGSVAG